MPRFKGHIARKLLSSYTYPPGTPFHALSPEQKYELTVDAAHRIKDQLRHKPVKLLVEHHDISVGKIEDAWVDPQPDGTQDFVVVFDVDESTEDGRVCAERLRRGDKTGLSLSHRIFNDGNLVPTEVSLVAEPARPGCYVECKANQQSGLNDPVYNTTWTADTIITPVSVPPPSMFGAPASTPAPASTFGQPAPSTFGQPPAQSIQTQPALTQPTQAQSPPANPAAPGQSPPAAAPQTVPSPFGAAAVIAPPAVTQPQADLTLLSPDNLNRLETVLSGTNVLRNEDKELIGRSIQTLIIKSKTDEEKVQQALNELERYKQELAKKEQLISELQNSQKLDQEQSNNAVKSFLDNITKGVPDEDRNQASAAAAAFSKRDFVNFASQATPIAVKASALLQNAASAAKQFLDSSRMNYQPFNFAQLQASKAQMASQYNPVQPTYASSFTSSAPTTSQFLGGAVFLQSNRPTSYYSQGLEYTQPVGQVNASAAQFDAENRKWQQTPQILNSIAPTLQMVEHHTASGVSDTVSLKQMRPSHFG